MHKRQWTQCSTKHYLQKFKNSKYQNTAAKRQPAVIGETTLGWTATNDTVIELVRAVNNHLPKQQKPKQLLIKQEN